MWVSLRKRPSRDDADRFEGELERASAVADVRPDAQRRAEPATVSAVQEPATRSVAADGPVPGIAIEEPPTRRDPLRDRTPTD